MEMMVTSAVLLLVMVGLTQLFITGHAYYRTLEITREVQEESLVAMATLYKELSEGSPGSLRVETSPAGVIFGSPRGIDGGILRDDEGRVLWRKVVCIYLDTVAGTPALVRKEELLSSPEATPPVITAAQSVSYFQALALPTEVIARHVSSFNVVGSNPLDLQVVVEQTVNGELFLVESQIQVSLAQ